MLERKQDLRRLIAQEKQKYDSSTRKAISDKILEKVETDPLFVDAEVVLLYYSLKDEVQTHEFIERWSTTKTMLLPVVNGEDIVLRQYKGKENLQAGAYHIEEPVGELFTDYRSIDLVVVPGVAFDRNGNRLGRGKGYYDRLLPLINAPKIGICFPFQLVDMIPTEAHDIRMDKIITI
jgi:5-formyltetrahydrofolate cyclo-ligase